MTSPLETDAGLVERLRNCAATRSTGRFVAPLDHNTMGYYGIGNAQLDNEAATRIEALTAENERLTRELDEAHDEIDEFDGDVERAVQDHERDCWKAFRRVIQANPGFDWYDYPDGIAYDEAAEFLINDLREAWSEAERFKVRALAAEARLATIEAETRAMRLSGTLMAAVMSNLAQRGTLDNRMRQQIDEMVKAWDAATAIRNKGV